MQAARPSRLPKLYREAEASATLLRLLTLLAHASTLRNSTPNMAPPSQLSIATGALNRLVKEEKSYHRELQQQEASIAKLETGESGDENADFQLRQEVGLAHACHS